MSELIVLFKEPVRVLRCMKLHLRSLNILAWIRLVKTSLRSWELFS